MAECSGIGTTLTFGTSGFVAKVKGYNDLGVSRGALDTTHMASAAGGTFGDVIFKESCPSDLAEIKPTTIDIIFDQDDNDMPLDQAVEEITIGFRAKSSQSSGATFVADGYISDLGAQIPHDDLMTASITITWTGPPTWTAGVAAV